MPRLAYSTNLDFLEIPKSLLDFEEEDKGLVVLLDGPVADDQAKRPVDGVPDAQAADHVRQRRVVGLKLVQLETQKTIFFGGRSLLNLQI